MLRRQIDIGEAEAIALAADLGASMVIMDEQEGRMRARQAGLSITGTLGILLRAKRSGQLPLIDRRYRLCGTVPDSSFPPHLKPKCCWQPENESRCL